MVLQKHLLTTGAVSHLSNKGKDAPFQKASREISSMSKIEFCEGEKKDLFKFIVR